MTAQLATWSTNGAGSDAPSPSSEAGSVRPRALSEPPQRASERPQRAIEGTVLITGIAGRLGRLLARRLHRVTQVAGIDRRPFQDAPKDLELHTVDLRSQRVREIFRPGHVRTIIHLGVMHDPRASEREHHSWNVAAFQRMLEAAAEFNVRKIVVLSSATLYGAHPDNPQFLTENAPLLGAQHFSAIRDLVEVDMLAQSSFWRYPSLETVILRPCHIVGGVRNAVSNYLRMRQPVTLLGFNPMVQLMHELDVIEAITLALEPDKRGIFNLRGPGEVRLSQVFEMLGKKPVALPARVARLLLARLWNLHIAAFQPPELDYLRYQCMVDGSHAEARLGFRPRYDLTATVRSVLSSA